MSFLELAKQAEARLGATHGAERGYEKNEFNEKNEVAVEAFGVDPPSSSPEAPADPVARLLDTPEPETPTVPKPSATHDGVSPWPARLPGLGGRTVDTFTPCRLCGTGTWARFGTMPLCLACARSWPGASNPEEARAVLHMLLTVWSDMDESRWGQAEVNALRDQVVGFWSDYPNDADQWFAEWRAAHPEARLG